jgi:hypothetical protein
LQKNKISVEALVANTNERGKAYVRFNKALCGKIYRGAHVYFGNADPIPCDYDKAKETAAKLSFNAQTFNLQSAYNLPPDPGAEGKKTLEGIDANNNGVRDDVEIAIYNYAPRPDQERYRQALIQWAKAMQKEIMVSRSKPLELLLEVNREHARASECIKTVSYGNGLEELRFLQKTVHDTVQRQKESRAFNERARQNQYRWWKASGDPVPCDYDKEKK